MPLNIFKSDAKNPMDIVQSSAKQLPVFTGEDMSIEFAALATRAGTVWAKNNKIAPDMVTESLVDCFSSFRVQEFVDMIQDEVTGGLPWVEFMSRLRDHLLGATWPLELKRFIGSLSQDKKESFLEYHLRVRRNNRFLYDTDCYYNEPAMMDLLSAHMLMDLALLVRTDDKVKAAATAVVATPSAMTLGKWCVAVEEVDERRRAQDDRVEARVGEALKAFNKENRASSRPTKDEPPAKRPRVAPPLADANASSSSSKTSSFDPSAPKVPALTGDERNLLIAHEGCFRCRKFYAGHRASAKSCEFPDPTKLPVLNDATAAAAKAKASKASASSSVKPSVNVVYNTEPAFFNESSEEGSDSDDDNLSRTSFMALTPIRYARKPPATD